MAEIKQASAMKGWEGSQEIALTTNNFVPQIWLFIASEQFISY